MERSAYVVELLIVKLVEDGAFHLVGVHGDPVEDWQTMLGRNLALNRHHYNNITASTKTTTTATIC